MLHFLKGNLLASEAQALVNTVNTVGVMGKGIALQFKEAFPANNRDYIKECKMGVWEPGKLLVVKDHNVHSGEKIIINFPTKKHWRNPSKYEYIEKGLKELVHAIDEHKISSIAIPPLGCGNGGLEWSIVREMIVSYLGVLPIDIYVFEPNDQVKAMLQKEKIQKSVKLTPGRAQLLYLLFYYESLGEYSSLFSTNKLAYFLQRMGEPMRLTFIKHHYGPYSQQIEHVLYNLNGTYLQGYEQKQAKAFEPLKLNYDKLNEVKTYIKNDLTEEQRKRFGQLIKFIDGFQSELSLEILSSVDFVLAENPSYNVNQVFSTIQNWNERKRKLIKKEHVNMAFQHLRAYSSSLAFL